MSKVVIKKKITALARCRPCMIITTLHENGVVNGGSFGAYTNVGPEEIGIAIGMSSDTYRNLRRTGEFVINIPGMEHAAALEVCGRNPTDGASEVILASMTTSPANEVAVPLITECVANIECRYWKEIEIGFHSFVIGKVVCGHIEEAFRDVDGGLDPVKARVPFGVRYPEPIYAVLDHAQAVKF
jgi:flavin reductase (DIM6/NTAB) family NADH-FMN oxidoreductase RutF